MEDVRERLEALVAKRFDAQRRKSAAEAELKKLDPEIIELMLSLGEEKMAFDLYNSSIASSHNSVIDRASLILAGVDGKIVDACTKKTPYSYVKVGERKATASEGGE